jgi:hypothetical protein
VTEHEKHATPARLQFEIFLELQYSDFLVKLNSPGALILGREKELNQI